MLTWHSATIWFQLTTCIKDLFAENKHARIFIYYYYYYYYYYYIYTFLRLRGVKILTPPANVYFDYCLFHVRDQWIREQNLNKANKKRLSNIENYFPLPSSLSSWRYCVVVEWDLAVACVVWRFCRAGRRSGVAAKFAREARENERRSRRTYLISFTVLDCFLFRFVCIELVSLIWFLQIWVAIYVYGTMINWFTLIKKLMQMSIVIVSGSIINASTVHLNGIWHLMWRYISKPVLGGHPVLSGHYSIPR